MLVPSPLELPEDWVPPSLELPEDWVPPVEPPSPLVPPGELPSDGRSYVPCVLETSPGTLVSLVRCPFSVGVGWSKYEVFETRGS